MMNLSARSLLILLLLAGASVWAIDVPNIVWTPEKTEVSAGPGEMIKVKIDGYITMKGVRTPQSKNEHGVMGPRFHTYSTKPNLEIQNETKVTVAAGSSVYVAGDTAYSPPRVEKTEGLEVPSELMEGDFWFAVPLRVNSNAAPGKQKVTIQITSMLCDTSCYPTKTYDIPITLTIAKQSTKPEADPVVEWTPEAKEIKGARGEIVPVKLKGVIVLDGIRSPVKKNDAGKLDRYHTYSTKPNSELSNETTIAAGPAEVAAVSGAIIYSEPKMEVPEGFKVPNEMMQGEFWFEIPIRINPQAKPGNHDLMLSIHSMICVAESCFLPKDYSAPLKLTITDGAVVTSTAPAVKPPPTAPAGSADPLADALKNARNQGLLSYLWISFTLGFGGLLTPCVFPMIPITVSFFTKRKHVSRNRSLRDAAVYALGIIMTFTGLGFALALIYGASNIGTFAANAWVNLGIATLFLVFAFNLFGYYEIQVPTALLNKLNSAANQGDGVGSVLLMGLVFSLTSFTCTVPFVGLVLVSAAQGDWLWPMFGMLAFSTAFAAPFFLLALFPNWLKSLPKSGGWLNSVKVVMGFLEIAAAMKFISNVDLVWSKSNDNYISREIFLGIWIVLAVLATIYLLGKIRFPHDTPVERLSTTRRVFAGCFVASAIFLSTGLVGNSLGIVDSFLPPKYEPGWFDDLAEAQKEAQKKGKPIFIDFTGKTCQNCRDMEKNVFTRPEISGLLDKFVLVRLFTDLQANDEEKKVSARNQEVLQKRFNQVALPYYVILSPDDRAVNQTGYTRAAGVFEEFLKTGLKDAANPAGKSVAEK